MAPAATQRQSSSRISSHNSVQLTPCTAHAKQATDSTSVTTVKIRDTRLDSGGAGDMMPMNHDTRAGLAPKTRSERNLQNFVGEEIGRIHHCAVALAFENDNPATWDGVAHEIRSVTEQTDGHTAEQHCGWSFPIREARGRRAIGVYSA